MEMGNKTVFEEKYWHGLSELTVDSGVAWGSKFVGIQEGVDCDSYIQLDIDSAKWMLKCLKAAIEAAQAESEE
jgi:hypothetical protein